MRVRVVAHRTPGRALLRSNLEQVVHTHTNTHVKSGTRAAKVPGSSVPEHSVLNPFNAGCSKLLMFEAFSAILV